MPLAEHKASATSPHDPYNTSGDTIQFGHLLSRPRMRSARELKVLQ